MRITLCDCQATILRELESPRVRRKDIAQTYRLCLESREAVEWGPINAAIIKRWGVPALNYVKRLAWSGKCFTEKGAA